MGLYYPQQHQKILFGTKNPTSFEISPAVLTDAYAGNRKALTSDYMSQLSLYFQYTTGNGGIGNYINILIEFSNDGQTWYPETVELPSPGETQEYPQVRKFDNAGSTAALTTYVFRISIPLADKYFRVSAKETIVAGSSGLLFGEALLSGK
jgi:hypothetical protein